MQVGAPSVLIVDDHAAFRSLARKLLEAEGFEVVGEAQDGRGAIAAVLDLRPEVVLLDIQLPDLDAFELLTRLGEQGSTPTVVLTSTRDEADFGGRISASGAAGFIPKAELSGSALADVLTRFR